MKSTLQNNVIYTNYLESKNEELMNEKAVVVNKLRESEMVVRKWEKEVAEDRGWRAKVGEYVD